MKRKREFSYLSMETDDELARKLGCPSSVERQRLLENAARDLSRWGIPFTIKSIDEEAEFWGKSRKMVERHVE